MSLKVFPVGTVLCTCSCSMGATSIVARPIVTNQTFIGIVPSRRIDSSYLYYLMDAASEHLQAQATGAIQQYLSRNDFERLRIPGPPVAIQRSIAAFLDRKTAAIDSLIAKKERLIELLQEKRQALITQAVTKGLDPNVSMKDSGIEWMGKVPFGWQVLPLRRRLINIEQGWSPDCESRPADDGEWGVLKVGCVNYGRFNSAENKALPSGLRPIPELQVKKSDVLISRANTRALVGSAAIVPDIDRQLLLCDKLFRLDYIREEVDPQFLVLALQSGLVRLQFERSATGASGSMQNIGQDSIREVVIPWPSVEEQSSIAEKTVAALTQLSKSVSLIEQQATKILEYRQALISAAVTGKIEIPAEEAA